MQVEKYINHLPQFEKFKVSVYFSYGEKMKIFAINIK